MKVLVFGAGVIGSYLCHVLCENGHEVSLLARGGRETELKERGLILRHCLQCKTTTDHPRVVAALDPGDAYDVVFAVMQYQQMRAVLPALAACRSPLVVLVGNNVEAAEMERCISAHSPVPKTVLFGFQPTGGRRENGAALCVRFGASHLTCGALHAAPDEAVRAALSACFPGKYQPAYVTDMDAWYKCHLAFILPVSFLCYRLDCDLTKASRAQINLAMDAAREGYGLLSALGYPILPDDSARALEGGFRRAISFFFLWFMAKTPLGRLAASDHCRNAGAEMAALDGAFAALRARKPDYPMPAWDALRSTP